MTLGTPVDFQGNFDGVLEETARSFLRGSVTLLRAANDTAKGFSARMTGGGFRAIGLPIDDVIDLVVENRLIRAGFVIDRKAVSFAH